jgi:hypothetical protein
MAWRIEGKTLIAECDVRSCKGKLKVRRIKTGQGVKEALKSREWTALGEKAFCPNCLKQVLE